jgi:hypothetical protein
MVKYEQSLTPNIDLIKQGHKKKIRINFKKFKNIYRISRPIKRTFFPEKCDLNSTCVLHAEGKY